MIETGNAVIVSLSWQYGLDGNTSQIAKAF